jgi:hypothetical protein
LPGNRAGGGGQHTRDGGRDFVGADEAADRGPGFRFNPGQTEAVDLADRLVGLEVRQVGDLATAQLRLRAELGSLILVILAFGEGALHAERGMQS